MLKLLNIMNDEISFTFIDTELTDNKEILARYLDTQGVKYSHVCKGWFTDVSTGCLVDYSIEDANIIKL